MAAANRGKSSETLVKKWLAKRSDADACFAFHRHPDPHAGSLQPVPADFEAMNHSEHHLIEVKEVKSAPANGSRLLPEKNFSADKVARMFKWQLAGSICHVLAHHIGLGVDEWRLIPLDHFRARAPSWQLRSFGPRPLDEILNTLFPLTRVNS